ncbi:MULTISPECIES: prolipoprotein diacylglyceryl transferase [Rhizobium]|uniref:Phosphatidylglycerol--prolipoprotein diacylglyceryl transferase n=1 Tax=Rhizobium favelukesii TaxID=348824 RepID=W6RE38_9HYPH|nr:MULTISPECIES: prolipoprotein diacylglyceryl transferase [Rhizobium]MCA0802602.1 prolipoprotein diacylglyceryl transferase [Rhizobium sp. T1473]MCS0457591.1 prolipoprotein diacylglyceryl transferase [Rhizobium favelukesii]UFS83809.1 prolipoprotein diacylglyceryl transferase [Rhizobium sp. T136]CDM58565.1 phosphatidylglycerol:prolipoprotein diacylglycerol transferase [Rhizobium favelukesii]
MPTAANLLAIMPFPEIDPIAFSLGPLSIHWYGLAYVAGIMLGWYYGRLIAANNKLWPGDVSPITKVQLDDFIIWVALGIVLGGRIGYILFYDMPAVIESPIRAIQIWNGGMSFHGGLTGTTIAMIIFARRNGIPIWSLFDIVSAVVPIGLFCGRIANFVNGELWGRLTDAPWGMVFCNQYIEKTNGYCPGGDFVRHPSQLYEAGLEGIVLLLVLAVLIYGFRALKAPGFVTGVFVCGYALSRIFVEFFREPDAQLGYLLGTNWLTMGMVLSTPMVLLGIWAMLLARRQAALQH